MKSIKDLREDYNLVTEKEEHDMNKLTQLVRAGLFDAKKLSALKRAMDKPADKMTAQEKRMMINLLDSLMAEVLSDKQVYRKIKQDVMKEAKSWETKDYLSKNDPRFGRGFPDQKDMPSVLLLKRKGIRVFPDGQKIGLYYAQAIDKYVSIPFQDINISGHSVHEETQLNELGLRDIVGGIADFLDSGNDGESKKEEPKYLKPGEAGKTKLNVGGPKEKEDDNDRPDATRSRMNSLNRQATQTMAKSARDERNVRESFKAKINEAAKKIQPGVDDEGTEGHRNNIGGGGFHPSGIPNGIGGPSREKGIEAGGTRRKFSVSSGSLRRQSSSITAKVRQQVSNTQQAVRDTKNVEYAKKIWKNIEAAKAKPKPKPIETQPDKMPEFKPFKPDTSPRFPGKPANIPEPVKPKPEPVKPKPQRVSPPEVKPDVKPSVKPTTPAREPEVPNKKPAVKPESKPTPAAKPGNKPDVAPTQQPASQPREKTKPEPKPETKQKEKGPRGSGLAALLPSLALGGVKGKPLTPGPAKLSLNLSAPKREGDPSAIASRQSSLEREMLKSQSKLRESVDLDGNLFELNSKAAKKVTALYESLNTKNKKKMVEMMNEGAESLEKVISFAARQ